MITPESFKKLFSSDCFLVSTLQKNERWVQQDFEEGDDVVNSFFATKKAPVPRIHRIQMSVADIWLKHGARRNCKSTVFDPTGKWKNDKSLLNVWSGYAIPESKVREYVEWKLLCFFLNHIKWTFVDNEEQYLQFLRRMAWPLQKMRKAGVAVGMGGDEGTGKSGVVLKLKDIIGDAHFAEIHDANDVCGEFNAPVVVSIFGAKITE